MYDASYDTYAEAHSTGEPELLSRLRKETYQKVLQPHMLSGPLQGRLLSFISKLIHPEHILEIGTFTGYSALCLAEGLQTEGKLDTIDHNEELYDFQRKYFKASPYKNYINQHLGKGLDVLPKLNQQYDLIFIDADKPNYPKYFDLLIPMLKKDGVLISDNVLWHGKVLKPVAPKDSSTRAIVTYNRLLAEDARLETVLLPIRDGISLSRKIV